MRLWFSTVPDFSAATIVWFGVARSGLALAAMVAIGATGVPDELRAWVLPPCGAVVLLVSGLLVRLWAYEQGYAMISPAEHAARIGKTPFWMRASITLYALGVWNLGNAFFVLEYQHSLTLEGFVFPRFLSGFLTYYVNVLIWIFLFRPVLFGYNPKSRSDLKAA